MKPRGAHKTIGFAAAGVALVLAGTVIWLVNKPPTADCNAEAPADHKVHQVRATKVVVHPWLGKHHVYGIFMVPNRYKQNKNYALTMDVRGFNHHFPVVQRADKLYPDDIPAEPGHYVKRVYLPTRVALWFLVTGLFGDLRAPCHWTLVFTEQTP